MKVYFNDKFYEVPKGLTPLKFCENCTFDTCWNCPWERYDMSQAVEITGITKEECDNYVSPPIPGRYYYSKELGSTRNENILSSLIYCEGTPIYDNLEIFGGINIIDYASGYKKILENSKSQYHDMFFNDNCYKHHENECLFSYIEGKLNAHFKYSHIHFNKEIPEEIWMQCVDIIKDFNKKSYTLIENSKLEVIDNNYQKDHFYFRPVPNLETPKIADNIIYLTKDPKRDPSFKELHLDALAITFDYYLLTGKNSNVLNGVHFTDFPLFPSEYNCKWQYEIPETTVDTIMNMYKEINKEILNLINPHIC